MPDEPSPAQFPRIRAAGRQHPLESRARDARCPSSSRTRTRRRSMAPSTSGHGPARAFKLDRGRARTGARDGDTGSTTASGRGAARSSIDAPATDAPRADLGRLQARRGRVLLLARRALAAQLAEAGRSRPERVGQHDHVRQPRPAGQAADRSGLHPRRRRADVSGRGAPASRGGPRHRRADCDASSSPTCAADCRTTST